eukprot:3423525-Prymnesium_polylepis.2
MRRARRTRRTTVRRTRETTVTTDTRARQPVWSVQGQRAKGRNEAAEEGIVSRFRMEISRLRSRILRTGCARRAWLTAEQEVGVNGSYQQEVGENALSGIFQKTFVNILGWLLGESWRLAHCE